MGRRYLTGACLVAALLVGCGRQLPPPRPLEPPTPLSLAEWKTLPVNLKYDESTFDRLKLADPKLQTERGWHEFMVNEIIPQRKIDIPGMPGVRP